MSDVTLPLCDGTVCTLAFDPGLAAVALWIVVPATDPDGALGVELLLAPEDVTALHAALSRFLPTRQ